MFKNKKTAWRYCIINTKHMHFNACYSPKIILKTMEFKEKKKKEH